MNKKGVLLGKVWVEVPYVEDWLPGHRIRMNKKGVLLGKVWVEVPYVEDWLPGHRIRMKYKRSLTWEGLG